MGFFDTYKDTGGLDFVKKAEKDEIIRDRTVLSISKCFYRVSKFEGKDKPQYIVVFDLDGEERAMGFGAMVDGQGVESRDRMLEGMQEYLNEHEGETIDVYLEKVGRSVLIKDAAKLSA